MARPQPAANTQRTYSWLYGWGFVSRVALVVILVVWPLLYQSGYAMRIMTTAGLYTMITVAVVIVFNHTVYCARVTSVLSIQYP